MPHHVASIVAPGLFLHRPPCLAPTDRPELPLSRTSVSLVTLSLGPLAQTFDEMGKELSLAGAEIIIWLDLAWLDLAWLGLAWLGLAWPGYGTTRAQVRDDLCSSGSIDELRNFSSNLDLFVDHPMKKLRSRPITPKRSKLALFYY